jgi:hypothetical protein
VVTVTCATGTQDIADIWAETGEELVLLLAHSIDWIGNNKVLVPQDKGDMLLVLCPDFAHKIARDGLSVPDVQRMLLEGTRTPIERWPRGYWPKLEARGYVENGTVPLAASPEQGTSRPLLLHLRPHLDYLEALRPRRRRGERRSLRAPPASDAELTHQPRVVDVVHVLDDEPMRPHARERRTLDTHRSPSGRNAE